MKTKSEDLLLLGYDRPIAGREVAASDIVDEALRFLDKQQAERSIEAYEAVSLIPYGGDLSGFFIIRGTRRQLDTLRASSEFDDLTVKAHMVMTGVRVLSGFSGDAVKGRRIERIRKLASTDFRYAAA